uniref:Uncharacterized protein n=1 Tax=Arundo donax TaxID=35708 RepID=A0A0A9BDV6_ARUDO
MSFCSKSNWSATEGQHRL